jgi:hypothetical protein
MLFQLLTYILIETAITDDTDDFRQQRKNLLDREISSYRRCKGLNDPHVTALAPGFGSVRSPPITTNYRQPDVPGNTRSMTEALEQ